MANNHSKSLSIQPKPIKIIDVGKFYLLYDGSHPGHPGLIIWKDDNANLYLAIKFGTTPNKDNVIFKYPIGQNAETSYYYKRFFLGKRKDFGSIELTELQIQNEDVLELINILDFFNPFYSPNVKNHSKQLYKLLIKKVTDRP